MKTITRRTGLIRSLSRTALPAVAMMALAAPASAYTTVNWSGCDPSTFASPPRVIIHTSEMEGFDLASDLQFADAVVDIHARLGEVGASSASIASVEFSDDPFVYGDWFGDSVPTIHVGFTSDPDASYGATKVHPGTDCHTLEAHILFRNQSLVHWLFMEPEDYGDVYYLAEHDLLSTPYFRISYLHELLHAFGLAHSNDSYSMMNYDTRPFANRPSGHEVMPLPDDVEALRALYPASGSRREIAVLNTWYEPNTTSTDTYPPAYNLVLCKPSVGSAWSSMFSTYCSTSATTDACPGDSLLTRVAVANYSTEKLTIQEKMWLSADDHYDGSGVDIDSSTVRTYDIGAQSSSQQGRVFSVPTGVSYDTDYYVIVRVLGSAFSRTIASDWIPLRGKIHIKARGSCH